VFLQCALAANTQLEIGKESDAPPALNLAAQAEFGGLMGIFQDCDAMVGIICSFPNRAIVCNKDGILSARLHA
jgi:hypothetical protein